MAEPVSIACGVAQFIGLAGQMADGISRIRRKFIEIKGAPKLIKKLNRELQILEHNLRQLSSIEQDIPEESKQTLNELLEHCWQNVEAVGVILMNYSIQPGDSSAKRVWKSVAASERRPELEELLRNLERSKTTISTFLSGMNLQMTSNVRGQLAAHAAVVEPSLERIETNLSVISTRSENIFSKTIQIEQNIEESSAEIMRHMDEVAKKLCDNIPRLLEDGFQKCLEGAAKGVLGLDTPQGCYTRGSNSKITNILPSQQDRAEQLALSTSSSLPAQQAYHYANQTRSNNRRSSFRKRTFSKTFPLPIGFIQTQATRSQVNHASKMSAESEGSTLDIEITLIPFRWLSSHGQVISLKRVSTYMNGSVWNLCIRSYNIVPHNATIIQACQNRDLEAMKILFKYRQASPYDVDAAGRVLMSHVWNTERSLVCNPVDVEQALAILKFLITQGFDPAPYVHELLEVYQYYGCHYAFFDSGGLISDEEVAVVKTLDEMLRVCLEHSQADPFVETNVLLSLWQNSLGGTTVPPLDSSYLFQEDLTGLDDLVFELPDQVFYDTMRTKSCGGGSFESWTQLSDQSYEALVYLCRGGEHSIKSKVFATDFAKSASRLDESQSCYCATNSNHLLFLALHDARLPSWNSRYRVNRIRKHVRRMLVECLRSGEDPEARCACRASWQSAAGYRLATEVAAEEGLLGVWESALEECGFDATRIIDECRYDGLPNLFDPPQRGSSSLTAPFQIFGQALYLTLSSIIERRC